VSKKSITSSLPQETSQLKLSAKTKSKVLKAKLTEINEFIQKRKEWEKGLHTSKTIIR